MEGFKLTSASATAEEALAAADQLEQAIGEICNGLRRAGNVPMEPMAVLVQFARDAGPAMEQLAADRAAFEAAGESARDRLALRVEELQQAVQARLAAERQVAQLLAAIEYSEGMLTNMQPHIPQACHPNRAAFIDNYVDPVLERLRAEIAAVKGDAKQTETDEVPDFVLADGIQSCPTCFCKFLAQPYQPEQEGGAA